MKTNTKDRGRRADQKQMEKIEAIGKTGIQLFSAKGYVETSMDDIAKVSRLTKGGIYYYFRSKEEILYFICSTFMDSKLKKIEEALIGVEDAFERIRVLVSQLVDHCTDNFKSARVVLGESHHLSRRHLRIIGTKRSRYHEIVSGAISDFLGRGRKEFAASTLSLTFLALLEGICLRFDPKDGIRPEDLSGLALELFTGAARNQDLINSPSEKQFLASGGQ